MKRLVAACAAVVLAGASWAATVTKSVTWSLPAAWSEGVRYPSVEGFRAVWGGDELRGRGALGAVGEPDLPYYNINIALPDDGTFGGVTAEAEWEPVDLGGQLPLPIVAPVQPGGTPAMPSLAEAYGRVYPSDVAQARPLEIASGVRMVPVAVTPFRWDGRTKTLYRAARLTVKATYAAPPRSRLSASASAPAAGHPDLRRMALSMTLNPDDAQPAAGSRLKASAEAPATRSLACYGNDLTADFIILSPNRFVDLWKVYADFRKGTELGRGHEFAVVNTKDIYAAYTTEHDDALKIHHYLEGLYRLGRMKYILLGAAAKKYSYDPETMIMARYVVAAGGLNQLTDEYYGCMDRLPVGTGKEVWDWDGDGYYMGSRPNGSFVHDAPANVDFKQDVIVFRFPLMAHVVDSGLDLTAGQVITNFMAKVTYLESPGYRSKYDYCLSGSTVFGTVIRGGGGDTRGMTELVEREREFFDGNLNAFVPEHSPYASDSELMPRDRHWQFLTYLRGNGRTYQYNSTQSNATYADMYDNSGAVFNIMAHGWARGCSPGDGSAVMRMKGYYTLFVNPIPCESGMYDYCTGYGITNTICFGEAPIVSPHGGLASYNNSRLGWVAGYKTSSNHGGYSSLIEYYLFRSLSGVTRWEDEGRYELMDAGEALMYAKNHYGDNYSSIMWGLAGVQVTGHGDPLARLPVQDARVWTGAAGTQGWNTNDANWQVVGGGAAALDHSRDVYLPLAGRGSQRFEVDGRFTSAGFYVAQDEGATLEIAGTNGTFKVYREAVVTNGNLRWTAAGGVARNGIRFAGAARGDIELPGNAPRYFGDGFVHVGTVLVSGGNVTLDTARSAAFGAGKPLDYEDIAFVAASPDDVAEWNTLRSRNPGIFQTDRRLRVVNSKLTLETCNIGGSGGNNIGKPLIYATNSTIRVRANPRWMEEYFVRPTYLHDSVLAGDYAEFAFGSSAQTGYDLYVSGTNVISGGTDIKLNGELRIHFLGEGASLELANTLTDGGSVGSVSFDGPGTLHVTAPQAFTGAFSVPSNVTVRCAVADAFAGRVTVEAGGTLALEKLPLAGIEDLTVRAGGRLCLSGATAQGVYQLVDITTSTVALEPGAEICDGATGARVTGDLADGYLIQTENVLYWKSGGGTWDLSAADAWTNALGEARAYADGLPLVFADTGDPTVAVNLGADVAPGFVDFRNAFGRYVLSGTNSLSLTSLAVGRDVAFEAPVKVSDTLRVVGGEVDFRAVDVPVMEVARGGTLRVTGTASVSPPKIRKVRFSFSNTYSAGNRAAIQELRLYNADGFFRLPPGTVIRDVAGQTVTVTGGKGTYGHTLTGATGDEQLGALVDGVFQSGNNKWWASKSGSPTWFEIAFPYAVEPLTGYTFCTADSSGRNPRAWTVQTSIDGTHWAQAALVSDYAYGATRSWMKSDSAPFSFVNANGFLTVREGGTLVADGRTSVNIELQAGAVLAVTNACCLTNGQPYARLTLPAAGGTVLVDLSRAQSSSEAFPVLCGFGITAEQFGRFACVQETAMLHLRNGDIYAATAGVMVPPYAATVSEGRLWSDIVWTDRLDRTFRWNEANLKADGEARLTVEGAVALENDADGTIARLTVLGPGSLTLAAGASGAVLEPGVLDDEAHAGALVWDVPVGSAEVRAGTDTRIGGGRAGTGLLTVGAGRKVTFMEGVRFANRAIDPAGWVRYAETLDAFSLADEPDAVYSFADARVVGDLTLAGKTIRSLDGDRVALAGTNISYYARSLLNFDVRGGLVEIDTLGATMSFGRTGADRTRYVQSGGTFRVLSEDSGTGGLLLGYEGGTEASGALVLAVSGGTFEVPDALLTFSNPAVLDLSGEARFSAGGYALNSAYPGEIYVGTNGTGAATLAVGSLGFAAGAAAIHAGAGASLVGDAAGAALPAPVELLGEGVCVAATNGTSLRLDGARFAGAGSVVFGRADGYDGTVSVGEASSLPARWTLRAGTLDLGALRVLRGSELAGRPSGGTVRLTLTEREYGSGTSLKLLACGDWAAEGEDLGAYFTLVLVRADGTEEVRPAGELTCRGGVAVFLPEGASDYAFPLYATATGSLAWSRLDWRDANGQRYTNNWYGVKSAELTNATASCTVTMDCDVAMETLVTVVPQGQVLTIASAEGCGLALSEALDDSASAGTNVLDITLGEGMTVRAGKALRVRGAPDSSVVHGRLVVGAGSTVTVVDGLWNGEVDMADATSTLRYEGTRTLDSVPSAAGVTRGRIVYAAPMAMPLGTATFGRASDAGACVTYVFDGGFGLTAAGFVAGAGAGAAQTFLHNAGDLVLTGDTFVLGGGTGGAVTNTLTGGSVRATEAVLVLGRSEPANLTVKNGTLSVLGVDTGAADNRSAMTLQNAVLEVGTGGVHVVSSCNADNWRYYPLNVFSSGTIRATADAVVDVPGTIQASGTVTLATANGATMVFRAEVNPRLYGDEAVSLAVEGDGTVVLETAPQMKSAVALRSGTLRLVRPGLIPSGCDVQFGGGALQVTVTRAQAESAQPVLLFPSAADLPAVEADTTVWVDGLGCRANGTFSKTGNDVYFTPAPVARIGTVIENGASGDWSSLTWTDAAGRACASDVWGTLVGDIVITNFGATALDFTGRCVAKSLTIVNRGTFVLAGDGRLSVSNVNDKMSGGRTELGRSLSMQALEAGGNTVVRERGGYPVNVFLSRRVTLPGWDNPANVTGYGTVAIGLGSRGAPVESVWRPVSNGVMTNQLLCGTWTFTGTNKATFPSAKPALLLTSTNAVLCSRATDLTGYGDNLTTPLTLEDGAEFQVHARDTYSRPLELRNGGRLLFGADAAGSDGRIFDLFKSAVVTVTGAEPSVIGGVNAVEDAYGNPTKASGIVAIRRANFPITVNEGATLKVYSRWIKSDQGSGTFIKRGAGVLEQFRESGSDLPFRIEAGTLRLVNAGTVTTGATENNAVLEVVTSDGFTKTLNRAVSGTGRVVKDGPGTLVLSAAHAYAGGTEVRAGTLKLGQADAVANAGTVTVDEGAWLDLGTLRPSGAFAVAGRVRVAVQQAEKNGEDWIRLFGLAEGAAFDCAHLTVLDVDGRTELTDVEKAVRDGAVWIKCQAYKMPLAFSSYASVRTDWEQATWMDANAVLVPSEKWAGLYGRTNLAVRLNAYNGVTVALSVAAPVEVASLTVGAESGTVELVPTADGFCLTSGVTVVDGTLQVYAGVVLGDLSGGGTLVATNFVPAYAGLFDADKWTGALELRGIETDALDVAALVNPSSRVVLGDVAVRSGVTVPAGCWAEVSAGGSFASAGLSVAGRLSVPCVAGAPAPVKGDVTVLDGARLDIVMRDFMQVVPVTDGTLSVAAGVPLYVNGVLRPAGTWEAVGGDIRLPLHGPFRAQVTASADWKALPWFDASETPVPVDPSFWAGATASDDVELEVLSDAALTVTEAISVGRVTVTGAGAVTLPSGLALAGVAGDGILSVGSGWPNLAGLADANSWTGTVRLAGSHTVAGQTFATCGNAGSAVEIAGTVAGWLAVQGRFDGRLVVNGTLEFNNGNSRDGGYVFGGALAGGGTIRTKNSQSDVLQFLGDAGGFTGLVQVAGSHCVSFGPQADDDSATGAFVVADRSVTVPADKTWTAASGVRVKAGASVAVTPGNNPFGCDVSFASGTTLNVLAAEGSQEGYYVTSGALSMASDAAVLFNGQAATGVWVASGGSLVRADELAATESGTPWTADYDGRPLVLAGADAGSVVLADVRTPASVRVQGAALRLKMSGEARLEASGGLDATRTPVRIDARGVNAYALATNAVAGAPAARWLVRGAVTGDVAVDVLPFVPMGYEVSADVVPGYGVRLVVEADASVRFGSVSLNLHNGTALVSEAAESGLHPVARSAWHNLKVENGATLAAEGLTFALSGSVSGYGLNNAPPDPIQKQYMDDSTSARTLTVSGLAAKFAAYRAIVYFSTDNANVQFSPMYAVADGRTVYYAGPAARSTVRGYTLAGRNAGWGHTGAEHSANAPCEGVNVLVTDVMTADSVVLGFRKTDGRATPAAVQIVEVGRLYDIPGSAYRADVTGSSVWADGTGEGLANHNDWQSHANSTLTLTMRTPEATLTFDTAVTGAVLGVHSDAGQALTLARTEGVDFVVPLYDFAGAQGTVTLAGDVASGTTVNLGRSTVFGGAVSGALGTAPAGATVRYAQEDLTVAAAQLHGTASNRFARAVVNGNVFGDSRTYLVQSDDDLTIRPSGGGNNDHMFSGTVVVEGGRLLLDSASAPGRFWFGACGASSFTQTGGETVANAASDSVSDNNGFLFGVSGSGNIPVSILGGSFVVTNSPVCFWQDPNITLTVGRSGTVRVKGLWGNLKNGTERGVVNLDAGGTLEVGAKGVASSLKAFNLRGGTLAAYADATTAEPLVLSGDSAIAADGGVTHTVSGAIGGTGNLTVGAAGRTGKVVLSGAMPFAGSVTVLPGTTLGLSAAVTRTNDLFFGAGASLDLTGSFTQAGTYEITGGAFGGDPVVTLNGQPLPDHCARSGKTITVTPAPRTWTNPVTGEAADFVYRFTGAQDAAWESLGNWQKYAGIAWAADADAKAPMLEGSSAWDPVVLDGAQVADAARRTVALSATMEGWNPRLALFNGMDVTVATLKKCQGDADAKWVWVDATSKLTFGSLTGGTNYDREFRLYVAADEGLVFRTDCGNTGAAFQYFFSTNGSVRYEAALTKGTHQLKRFDLALGEASPYRWVRRRTLVSYASASVGFATDDLRVTASGAAHPLDLGRAPTAEDPLGSYAVTKEGAALAVSYVAYSPFYTNLADNATVALSDLNARAGAAGGETFHVGLGAGVTLVFDEASAADNVAFDAARMTSGTTFVKAGAHPLVLSSAPAFAGRFEVREGVFSFPADALTNDLTVAGGTVDLQVAGGLKPGETYRITSGALVGLDRAALTVNGESLSEAWQISDGQLVWRGATEPFRLSVAATESRAWRSAAWRGDNGLPVEAAQWDGPVGAVVVDVAEGVSACLTEATNVTVATLTVTGTGALAVEDDGTLALANVVAGRDTTVRAFSGTATVGAGRALTVRTGVYTDAQFVLDDAARLTVDGEVAVADAAGGLDGKAVSVASNGVLRLSARAGSAYAFTGEGQVCLTAGTWTAALDTLSVSVRVGAGATLNLTGDLTGPARVITSGAFTLDEGGFLKVGGEDLPATWKRAGNRLLPTGWTYPVRFAPQGGFATLSAGWTDSTTPTPRTYYGGFADKVDSVLVDGYGCGEGLTWTNDVVCLRTDRLTLDFFHSASLSVVMAEGCRLEAGTIDAFGYGINEQPVHLRCDTGAATLVPGQDTRLYGNGSGPVTFTSPAAKLTFCPAAGAEVIYSGALMGAGALEKAGAGKVTLTGSGSTFMGALTVREGILRAETPSALGSAAVTVSGGTLEAPADTLAQSVTLSGAGCLNLTLADGLRPGVAYTVTSGTLAGANVTVNGQPLTAPWQVRNGRVVEVVAVEPFGLDAPDGSSDWVTAEWRDAVNGLAVPAERWGAAVGEACVRVASGRSAALSVTGAVAVAQLTVTNAGALTVSGTLAAAALDDSASSGVTAFVGTPADVRAGADTRVAAFTGTASVAAGRKLTVASGVYTEAQFSAEDAGTVVVAGGAVELAATRPSLAFVPDGGTVRFRLAAAQRLPGTALCRAVSTNGFSVVDASGDALDGTLKVADGVLRFEEALRFPSYVLGAWDGFENAASLVASEGFSYVANLSGGTLNADGSVTLESAPLSITGGTAWNNRASGASIAVAMLVSGVAGAPVSLASVYAGGKDDYIGWCVPSAGGKACAYYNQATTRPAANAAAASVPAGSGCFWYVFEYDNSGTFVRGMPLGGANLTEYVRDTGCKDGNWPGAAVNIGGKSGGAWLAQGMRVYAVRICNVNVSGKLDEAKIASNARYQALGLARTTSVAMRGKPVLWLTLTDEEIAAGRASVTLPNFAGTLESATVYLATEAGAALQTVSVAVDDAAKTVTATLPAVVPRHYTATAADGAFADQAWNIVPFESNIVHRATLTAAGSAAVTFGAETPLASLAVDGAGTVSFALGAGVAAPAIPVYDLSELSGTAAFAFDPGPSARVVVGANATAAFAVPPTCALQNDGWVRYDFPYTGAVASGYEYAGSNNVLTLYGSEMSGARIRLGGSGTFRGAARDNEFKGLSAVEWLGNYTHDGNTYLGMTHGTLSVAEGARVVVPHLRMLNSSATDNRVVFDVRGEVVVDSTSANASAWSDRGSYKGILFGHWHGQGAYNVYPTGRLLATNAYLQIVYTAEAQALNVTGGVLKVRAIHANEANDGTVTLSGGGVLELAEGFLGQTVRQNFGRGTVRAYSYGGSSALALTQAMVLTDAADGTAFDPAGLAIVVSNTVSGAGRLVVADSAAEPGRVVLGVAPAHTGGTEVRSGTLEAAFGVLKGDVSVAAGAALNLTWADELDPSVAYALTDGELAMAAGSRLTVNGGPLPANWVCRGNRLVYEAAQKPSIVSDQTSKLEVDDEGKMARVSEVGTNTSVTVAHAGDYTIEVPAHIGYVGGVTDAAKVKVYGAYGAGRIDLTGVMLLASDGSGTAVSLDPGASLEVGGKTVAVTPALTGSDDDLPPLAVSDGALDLGVRTIPGLSYRVLEVSLADGTATPVEGSDVEASEVSTRLRVDTSGRPSGFYRVEVYK